MEEIEVLIPVSQVEYGEIEMVGRPRDLDGKLIGFMWNHKPNGDLLLKGLEAALRESQEKLRRCPSKDVSLSHFSESMVGDKTGITSFMNNILSLEPPSSKA